MKISAPSGIVEVKEWPGRQEAAAYLGQYQSAILLEEQGEDIAYVSVKYTRTEGQNVAVGIAAPDTGFEPETLVVGSAALMVIGFGRQVVGIDLLAYRVKFHHSFETYFRDMVYKEQFGIIAFEEIGVTAISRDGDKLWEFSEDVLTSMEFEDSRVNLQFMDSPPVSIDLGSGRTG